MHVYTLVRTVNVVGTAICMYICMCVHLNEMYVCVCIYVYVNLRMHAYKNGCMYERVCCGAWSIPFEASDALLTTAASPVDAMGVQTELRLDVLQLDGAAACHQGEIYHTSASLKCECVRTTEREDEEEEEEEE